jgi:hypothetical protein
METLREAENALIWTPAMEKHCSVSLAWYEARRER